MNVFTYIAAHLHYPELFKNKFLRWFFGWRPEPVQDGCACRGRLDKYGSSAHGDRFCAWSSKTAKNVETLDV